MSEKRLINKQAQIFNESIDTVERANQDLLKIYKKAQANLEKRVAVLKVKIEKGLFNEFDVKRKQRIESFVQQVKKDIVTLKRAEYQIYVDGFVENYANTYVKTGFTLEGYVNKNFVGDQYVSLGYTRPNLKFVESYYKNTVATEFLGGTINQRIAADITVFTKEMRKAVAQATVEGISRKEFTKRLQNIDGVLSNGFSNATSTARTELLRGYSFGNEEAINVSKDAGVEGEEIWDATLDKDTRPTHAQKNQTQPESDGLYYFPDGSSAVAPRMPGLSAKETINCRCSKYYVPKGFTPTARTATVKRGSNKERVLQSKNITADKWQKEQRGQRTAKEELSYRRSRAKR